MWARAFLILLSLAFAAAAQTGGWKLVWSDEFDGAALDAAKWTHADGGHGWGNNELQYYTNRQENAFLENGMLVIQARAEKYTGAAGVSRDYTSARLITKGKFARTYGRIEARMKLPSGQGIWPAFWMLGEDIDRVGWPECGEIDIMENIGREPATLYGTLHGPGYSGGESISGAISGPKPLSADFHVFGIEWEPNVIRWYVDGKLYFALTPSALPKDRRWVFDRPHHLLLNLAVGGRWPGNPDASTTFPQRLAVDWVRVYERPHQAAPLGNVLVYTRNGVGYVHDNIADSVAALRKLGAEAGFAVEWSEDPEIFSDERLKPFRAIVFSNSNNEAFLKDSQRDAFMRYVQRGGGYVGIHSATGSERGWDWYRMLAGGRFVYHPKIQTFLIRVKDTGHPATRGLPAKFEWSDECYYHDPMNPGIAPLFVTDPTKLDDPKRSGFPFLPPFGDSLPLAWTLRYDGGRTFYTALGHKKEHYRDPLFLRHLLGGILWAMGEAKESLE
ncbi:MAG TPA: hypothetical protein DEH78_00945 [Solibacterales bacterium]|nr:hypothetical protein [Bryobacterales bacterium]